MNEMKTLTLNDKTYDCFRDSVARNMATWSALTESVSGDSVDMSDASNHNLTGLRVFGKTTQDGTPTPDAPVELVSVGDRESVTVKVTGKNLLNTNDLLLVKNNGCTETKTSTSIIVTNTAGGESSYLLYRWLPISALDGKNITVSLKIKANNGVPPGILIGYANADGSIRRNVAINQITGDTFTFTYQVNSNSEEAIDCEYICFWFYSRSLGSVKYFDIQVELGSTATEYEPYGGQSMTISTPNGLPGIPVTSDGNYTDANGQQWICDEIDFARGVYVQRVDTFSLAVADMNNSENYPGWTNVGMEKYYPGHNGTIDTLGIACMSNISNKAPYINTLNGNDVLLIPGHYGTTQTEWKANYPELVVNVSISIPIPIETPLSEEELAAFADLHTYKDHTVVSNDAGAWMDLEYVMDAKKYIDGLIAGTIIPATVE